MWVTRGPERLEDIRFDTLDRVMQVNFFAAVQLVQAFCRRHEKTALWSNCQSRQ